MKRIPQPMMETLARLAIEFDRTSEQDTAGYYKAKEQPYGAGCWTPAERAAYLAGWSAAKTTAIEQVLRALVPQEEWDSTIKRWCATYERLAGY